MNDANANFDLFNNLTFEQRLELSQYAADMINSARAAYGTLDTAGKDVVAKGAIDFAHDIAKQYTADDWSGFKYHDMKAINDLRDEFLSLKTQVI